VEWKCSAFVPHLRAPGLDALSGLDLTCNLPAVFPHSQRGTI